jgi:hypothetical protein
METGADDYCQPQGIAGEAPGDGQGFDAGGGLRFGGGVRAGGMLTFRRLTNEEALKEFGSSFVFVGARPASLEHVRFKQ